MGLIELLGLLASVANLDGPFWQLVQSANDHFEVLGVAVISVFLIGMVIAFFCFRRVFRRRDAPAQTPLYIQENLARYALNGEYIDRSGV